MIVYLNGRFVPEEKALVSVFDRAFRYGDGLFETMLVVNGKIFRGTQHFARLEQSAKFFKISLPTSIAELRRAAEELLRQNAVRDAVLRLQISRGAGPRSYAPTGDERPHITMSVHPAASRNLLLWKLTVASLRQATNDPLARHKTISRMLHVMVAVEARERGADESLILNTDGDVTEGGSSNVFWIEGDTVCTTPISSGVLPGVTRAAVLELCQVSGISSDNKIVRPEELISSEGVFLTLTSRGIIEAVSIDATPLRRSPVITHLQNAFEALVQNECA